MTIIIASVINGLSVALPLWLSIKPFAIGTSAGIFTASVLYALYSIELSIIRSK